jgi:hypothetical protein
MVVTDADSASYSNAFMAFHTWYTSLAVGLRDPGSEPSEISVSNGTVMYGDSPLATVIAKSNGNMDVYFAGGVTPAGVQALLRNITVRTKGDKVIDGSQNVSISFRESSHYDGSPHSGISVPVNTIGVNDAPILEDVAGGGVYAAGATPTTLVDRLRFDDADSPYGDHFHGSLTVSITGNGAEGDRLSVVDGEMIRVVGSDLYRGDRLKGSFSGGEHGEPLKVQFGEAYWPEVVDVIKQLAFSTAADADLTLDRQIQITYADAAGAQAEPALVSVDVVAPTAPLLDTTLSPELRPTNEDALTPASTQVASLLQDAVIDLDSAAVRGIAITYAASAHGKWQYSLQKDQWQELGSPTATAARLLPGWARLRFVPSANFNGAVSLRYRAWDQSEGTAGGVIDTTGDTGGLTSLSAAVETATLAVLPVNDAPVLDNAPAQTLFGALEDSRTPRATSVYSLVWRAVSDDVGDRQGIAVFRAPSEQGSWQFQLTDRVWRPMGEVSESSALLLPATAHVRFVPRANFHGTVRLYYRAWDQTEGTVASKVSLVGNIGPAGAYSVATESATLVIEPVSDPPSLTLGGTVQYALDAAAVLLAPFASVRDFDSPSFAGGQLTVRITSGAGDTNWLGLSSAFTVDAENNIRQGDLLVGTLNADGGQGTTDLVVTFSSAATRALAQEVVRAVSFRTIGRVAGQRTVSFTLSDGQGGVSEDVAKLVEVV